MALIVRSGCCPSHFHASQSPLLSRPSFSLPLPRRRTRCRRRIAVRASSSDGSDDFSWRKFSLSVQHGSERALSNLREILKKETGFDVEGVGQQSTKVFNIVQDVARKSGDALVRFRMEKVPSLVDWNKWENWKVFFLAFSCQWHNSNCLVSDNLILKWVGLGSLC